MNDKAFTELVRKAIHELSPEHVAALEHVALIVADEPSDAQRKKLQLRNDHLLLGLFEGVPRTQRGGQESGIVADTITIFKQPLLRVSRSEDDLYRRIKRTVWHELAHYFGLSHEDMDRRRHPS